eukprot:scaffold116709_cov47-Prasinocladus_malaysianus.AAC.1
MSANLKEDNINMYYEMLRTYEGFPRGLQEEFNMTGTQFVMYRNCTHQLFNSIEASFNVLKRSALAQANGAKDVAVVDRQAHFFLQGSRVRTQSNISREPVQITCVEARLINMAKNVESW